jgi:hypothetical protein
MNRLREIVKEQIIPNPRLSHSSKRDNPVTYNYIRGLSHYLHYFASSFYSQTVNIGEKNWKVWECIVFFERLPHDCMGYNDVLEYFIDLHDAASIMYTIEHITEVIRLVQKAVSAFLPMFYRYIRYIRAEVGNDNIINRFLQFNAMSRGNLEAFQDFALIYYNTEDKSAQSVAYNQLSNKILGIAQSSDGAKIDPAALMFDKVKEDRLVPYKKPMQDLVPYKPLIQHTGPIIPITHNTNSAHITPIITRLTVEDADKNYRIGFNMYTEFCTNQCALKMVFIDGYTAHQVKILFDSIPLYSDEYKYVLGIFIDWQKKMSDSMYMKDLIVSMMNKLRFAYKARQAAFEAYLDKCAGQNVSIHDKSANLVIRQFRQLAAYSNPYISIFRQYQLEQMQDRLTVDTTVRNIYTVTYGMGMASPNDLAWVER